MALTWYGNQSPAEGCNLGALAMLWPLLKEMQVAEIINQHLPADPQAEYDHGRVLSLLIAARLYSPVALVNVGSWAAESGADILWDIPVEKLNDDRFGRSVDTFFSQRHSILASLALHVSRKFDVPLSAVHYDPTHILLHGRYEESQSREKWQADQPMRSDENLPPAHITQGRPMSDAPSDVQMVHAGLCTIVDQWGPLPIFGHTVGGNENGHTAVAEQLALLRKHLAVPELTMISDRGTFSVGHLLRLKDAGYAAITAAPWEEFRTLFDQERKRLKWKVASYLFDRARASALPGELAAGALRTSRRPARTDRQRLGPVRPLPRDLCLQHGGPEGRPEEPREVGPETPRGPGEDHSQRRAGPSLYGPYVDRTARRKALRRTAGRLVLPI